MKFRALILSENTQVIYVRQLIIRTVLVYMCEKSGFKLIMFCLTQVLQAKSSDSSRCYVEFKSRVLNHAPIVVFRVIGMAKLGNASGGSRP